MNQHDRPKKKSNGWAWLVFLVFVAPEIGIPVGIIAGIIWLVKNKKPAAPRERERYTSLKKDHGVPFDCQHKDRSLHNVRRGKEIDPWDRPDIDISKYQRRE